MAGSIADGGFLRGDESGSGMPGTVRPALGTRQRRYGESVDSDRMFTDVKSKWPHRYDRKTDRARPVPYAGGDEKECS